MITTHLVLLSFLDGASASAAVETVGGASTHMPHAFFDGFSEVDAAEGFGGFTTHQPHAFFDGFTEAEVVEPETEPEAPTAGGVWLAGLRRRRLQQLQRDAAAAADRRKWRRRRRQKRQVQALGELRDVLAEAAALDLPEDAADAVSEALAPYTTDLFDGRVTPFGMIDWQRLQDDALAVADVSRALLAAADAMEEEDAAFVMMMLH